MLTGNRDIDRYILTYLDHNNILKCCSINKYFYTKVCDDIFFCNLVSEKYPETIKYKDYVKSRNWKKHYLKTIKYIKLLKNYYYCDYKQTDSSPELLYILKCKYSDEDYNENEEDDEDISNEKGSMLVKACEVGDLSIVKYLIDQGTNINFGEGEPLINSCSNNHLKIVKYLIDKNAQVNIGYNTPLVMAIRHTDNMKLIKYLVEHGADVKASNNRPLKMSAINGNLNVLKYLVEHGVDVHYDNNVALKLALQRQNTEVVKYLESLQQ